MQLLLLPPLPPLLLPLDRPHRYLHGENIRSQRHLNGKALSLAQTLPDSLPWDTAVAHFLFGPQRLRPASLPSSPEGPSLFPEISLT